MSFFTNQIQMSIVEFIIDNQSWLLQSYSQGFLFSILSYLLYVELSPKMGGIIVRPGPDGQLHFNLSGLIPLIKYPFTSLQFWSPSYWDLNFIIFTQMITGTYMITKYSLTKLL